MEVFCKLLWSFGEEAITGVQFALYFLLYLLPHFQIMKFWAYLLTSCWKIRECRRVLNDTNKPSWALRQQILFIAKIPFYSYKWSLQDCIDCHAALFRKIYRPNYICLKCLVFFFNMVGTEHFSPEFHFVVTLWFGQSKFLFHNQNIKN